MNVKQRNEMIVASFCNINAREYGLRLIPDINRIIFLYYYRDEAPYHWKHCTPNIGISFDSNNEVSNETNNIVYWQGYSDDNYRGNAMSDYWIQPNTERHVYIIESIGPIYSFGIGIANKLFNIKKKNYLEFVSGRKVFVFGGKHYSKGHGYARSIIDDQFTVNYTQYWSSKTVFQCFDKNNGIGIKMRLIINTNAATTNLFVNGEKFINDETKPMSDIFGEMHEHSKITLVGWIFPNDYTLYGNVKCGFKICDYYVEKED